MQLGDYLDSVPAKKTKTQLSLDLPSGRIIRKLEHPEYVKNESSLLRYLEEEYPDMISWTPKINWSELKKVLQISGDSVIRTDTGELISPECISVRMVPDSVDVK